MAKLTGHDFVLPDHSAMEFLDDNQMSKTQDIRSMPQYQELDTPMDFLGGDSGTQSVGYPQPRKLKFLYE